MLDSFVLADVPPITGHEHADIYLDALSIALIYGDSAMAERKGAALYDHLSGCTGRGWLVGFDDADWQWERYGRPNGHSAFAVSGLAACLEQVESLLDAYRYLDLRPEWLWHTATAVAVDAVAATALRSACEPVDSAALRAQVLDRLRLDGRPVLALMDLPGVDRVDVRLLCGWESAGDVVLGRALEQGHLTDNSGPHGYFRLADWESQVVAVFGIGGEQAADWDVAPGLRAARNGLRLGASRDEGTRHYGLRAYDAWAAALLDEAWIDGHDDPTLGQRLLYHSACAGTTACQKAFCRLPAADAPGMGVINGYMWRAASAPGIIHGLMWDVWQVVGGYWRGIGPAMGPHWLTWSGAEEIARFRGREVRERAVAVLMRAREVDAQALADLDTVAHDWMACRRRGQQHPCPCWGTIGCERV